MVPSIDIRKKCPKGERGGAGTKSCRRHSQFKASLNNVYTSAPPRYKECKHYPGTYLIHNLNYNGQDLKNEDELELIGENSRVTDVSVYYSKTYDGDNDHINKPLLLRIKDDKGRTSWYYNADADKNEEDGKSKPPENIRWREIHGGESTFYGIDGNPTEQLREQLNNITCKLHNLHFVDIEKIGPYKCACNETKVNTEPNIYSEYTKYRHSYGTDERFVRYGEVNLLWKYDDEYDQPITLDVSKDTPNLTVYYWNKDEERKIPLLMEVYVEDFDATVSLANGGKPDNSEWTMITPSNFGIGDNFTMQLSKDELKEKLKELTCRFFRSVITDDYCKKEECRSENEGKEQGNVLQPQLQEAHSEEQKKSLGEQGYDETEEGEEEVDDEEEEEEVEELPKVLALKGDNLGGTSSADDTHDNDFSGSGETRSQEELKNGKQDESNPRAKSTVTFDNQGEHGRSEATANKGLAGSEDGKATSRAVEDLSKTLLEAAKTVGPVIYGSGLAGAVVTKKLLESVKDLIPPVDNSLELPAADLSDQVPDTESETKILLQGADRGASQTDIPSQGSPGSVPAPTAPPLPETEVEENKGDTDAHGEAAKQEQGPEHSEVGHNEGDGQRLRPKIETEEKEKEEDAEADVYKGGTQELESDPVTAGGNHNEAGTSGPQRESDRDGEAAPPTPQQKSTPAAQTEASAQPQYPNPDEFLPADIQTQAATDGTSTLTTPQESEKAALADPVSGGILGTSALACFTGWKLYSRSKGDPWVRQI